jgi:adenylate cyclase
MLCKIKNPKLLTPIAEESHIIMGRAKREPSERYRLDFVQELVEVNESSRTFVVILKPNPVRYEWRDVEGKRYLYDKLDNIAIPEEAYNDLAKQAIGKPIYYQPSKIDNIEKYIESRRLLINRTLDGVYQTPSFEDKSEEFLESLSADRLAFVIISLDIVSSTKLATATDPETYVRLISVILYELSELVPKFWGHVLKYTGDGLIAYFPEPSFISKNDLAIYCSLALRKLVYGGLNAVFRDRGLPQIAVRIGIDAGEAYIVTIGSPETKQHKDIIGAVVSLAAKIQARAKPGEIYLGDTVNRNLHTSWRQICEPVDLGKDWEYKDTSGGLYKVHRVKLN